MGIISTIETKLERIVENPFASKHQIDLAALEIALNRLVEKEKVNVLGVYMVPTFYFVVLERNSFRDYEPFFGRLSLRLEAALQDSFKERGYKVAGNLCVSFQEGPVQGGTFFVLCQWKDPNGNDQEKASTNRAGEKDDSRGVNAVSLEEKASAEADCKDELPLITQRDVKTARLVNKERGDSFIIDQTPSIIGRGMTSHLALDDEAVSDRHAQISKAYGKLVLEDLQSTNGTRVNRRYIKKAVLQGGDEIIVGSTVLIVET
jgi:hypothetical protein